MEDKLIPMEAEVLEMQPPAKPCDFYGTATPQVPKRDLTPLWVSLCLAVVLVSSVTVLLAMLEIRLVHSDADGWMLTVAERRLTESDERQIQALSPVQAGQSTVTQRAADQREAGIRLQGASDAAGALDAAAVYRKVSGSVVLLEYSTLYETCTATGVVLTQDGYLLTAAESLAGVSALYATLPDGTRTTAQRVAEDSSTGIALLKVEAEGLSPAEFGRSANLQVGQTVYSVGNPYGAAMPRVLTQGILSAKTSQSLGGASLELLQTTAGDGREHGCPIFNVYGQVVGLTCPVGRWFTADGSDPCFALDSTGLQSVVSALLTAGSGQSLSLGMEVGLIPENYLQYFGYPGRLWVEAVYEGSPVDQVLYPLDVITAVDGVEVSTLEQYRDCLSAHQVGDTVKLTIYRAGNWYTATVPVLAG